MFVLLRDLQRLRRKVALPAPETRGSLAVRYVDAGSCNGCEHELGATSGPHYDLARFGLTITASPRHADLLLVSGPVTKRMLEPLRTAYAAMPEPRMVAALGDCALGLGLLGDPDEYVGSVADVLPVLVRIPGCPPTPEVIAARLLEAMQRRA
ncbi:MAG: NADH-quinone oxidoreductase subunit B family protein [Thermoleophilia bacterium]